MADSDIQVKTSIELKVRGTRLVLSLEEGAKLYETLGDLLRKNEWYREYNNLPNDLI